MTDSWTAVTVSDVEPGDRVRLPNGVELLVSKIEPNFMGREAMVALIEDTPDRWYKQPAAIDGPIEVFRA
jgi:hypothetical protein